MARASKASKRDDSPAPDRAGRAAQIRQVWSLTRSSDRKLPLVVLGPAIGLLAALVVAGVLIGHPVYLSILGVHHVVRRVLGLVHAEHDEIGADPIEDAYAGDA